MLVADSARFHAAISALSKYSSTPLWVVDTETSGLKMFARTDPARLCGIAIKPFGGPSWYFSFRHREGPNLPLDLLEPLRQLLRGKTWLCHNASFDLKILWCDGFDLPEKIVDTIIASHEVEESEESYALKALGEKYLGGVAAVAEDAELQAELKRRKLGKGDICQLPAALVSDYALADVRLTEQLYRNRMVEVERWRLVDHFNERCTYLLELVRLEIQGILLDQVEVRRQQAQIGPKTEQYRKRIIELSGKLDLNINSPKQLSEWLKLPSTAQKVLEETLEQDPREDIRTLLDYRSLYKANSTYFDPLLACADSQSRVHTNYNLHRTVTQRLSSSEPNLQNCSRDQSNRAYSVRQCLTAPEGSFLMEADYSSIEPRLAAHYSQDPGMLAAFRNNHDFHTAIARTLYKKYEVTKEERTSAKSLGLGVLYGMGALKSAMKLGLRHAEGEFHHELVWVVDAVEGLAQVPCSMANAEYCTVAGKCYVRSYYQQVPELEPLIKKVRAKAASAGYIRVPLTGAVQRFNPYTRNAYKAFNGLIQCSAAEVLRRAFVALSQQFTRLEDPKIVLSVHDSLAFEIAYGSQAQAQISYIKEVMEATTKVDVPLTVECKIGHNLGRMEVIDV